MTDTTFSPSAPHVYEAIAAVTGKLAKTGISKDQVNTFDKYKFRGIDDVYNAVARHLADAKLCVIPRVVSRQITERESQKGGALFYVVVEVDYDIVSAVDGSRHTAHVVGEAMDRGDKATNKAMSAAFKYLCLQLFCIPTEGDNDADAQTHEVAASRDTKLVNKWAKALTEAQDDSSKLYSIWAEIKADHDFAGAVWATLPRAMKDRIKDSVEEHGPKQEAA
jgi:hypothetical protein